MARLFEFDIRKKEFAFRCAQCGKLHRGSPSFGYAKPPSYFDVPEAERGQRIFLTGDVCVIDDRTFYIRALLEIPIRRAWEPFAWGVWVTQSQESFRRYLETFDQDQTGMGSFGWLGVDLPTYRRTAKGVDIEFLKCNVLWGPRRGRPLVELQDSDHPLCADQRQGISWERAIAIAQTAMHPPL